MKAHVLIGTHDLGDGFITNMVTETTNDGIGEMALRSYVYGRWTAPYWFIGPEQGQAPETSTTVGINKDRHARIIIMRPEITLH